MNSSTMPCKRTDLGFGADIPDTTNTITPPCEDQVEGGVGGDAVNTAQVAVIRANDLRKKERKNKRDCTPGPNILLLCLRHN